MDGRVACRQTYTPVRVMRLWWYCCALCIVIAIIIINNRLILDSHDKVLALSPFHGVSRNWPQNDGQVAAEVTPPWHHAIATHATHIFVFLWLFPIGWITLNIKSITELFRFFLFTGRFETNGCTLAIKSMHAVRYYFRSTRLRSNCVEERKWERSIRRYFSLLIPNPYVLYMCLYWNV